MSDAPRPLHCVEGWYTDDPEEFALYARGLRNWTYRKQLKADLRGWTTWAWWRCSGESSMGTGTPS